VKKVAIVLIVVLLLGAAGGYFALRSGFLGSDDWIVNRVVRIAETYIEPTIDFDEFDWDGGRTITLEGVTLTSDDGTEVVKAGRMLITTARVPLFGGAFVIEGIELDDATLRLIQTTGPDGGIEFKGLIPLVKRENIANQEQVEEEVRLSEAFQIRSIVLKNGGFEYDAGDGSQPMTLSGIDMDVELTPEDDGLYAMGVDLHRDKIFTIGLSGELDINAMALRSTDLSFDADLASEEAMSALPPQIQSLLREYEVSGALESTITGDLMLTDPIASDITVDLTLDEGNVAIGEYQYPVSGAKIGASLSGKQLNVSEADISMLGGILSLDTASADLSADGWPGTVAWRVTNIDLEKALRQKPEDKPARMAGLVNTSGTVNADLKDLPGSIAGDGELNLRQGRLVSLPIISDLIDVMDVVAAATGTTTYKDTAEITFTLDGTGIEMPDKGIQISTQLAAVRGRGRINYDQTLDLLVNGGPVEKIQDQLGEVGNILGAVTDGLVKYDIEGTVSDPKISVRPLGIGG
jgi:uncharacterized protein involved in outer membrane biogenesis